MAVGAALWTALTLRMDWFQHPRLQRTAYRLPGKRWSAFHLWDELKLSMPDGSIQVDLQHAKKQVWLRLEGALSSAEAAGLAVRIRSSLARSKSRLVLDLSKLHWDKVDDSGSASGEARGLSLPHSAGAPQTRRHPSRGNPARRDVSALPGLRKAAGKCQMAERGVLNPFCRLVIKVIRWGSHPLRCIPGPKCSVSKLLAQTICP